jgi:lipoate-protein ligase B
MIDTVVMCKLYDQNYENKLNGNYYEELNRTLRSVEDSDVIFLVGHHPVYTSMQGRTHSSCLHKYLLILLKLYGETAYIGKLFKCD